MPILRLQHFPTRGRQRVYKTSPPTSNRLTAKNFSMKERIDLIHELSFWRFRKPIVRSARTVSAAGVAKCRFPLPRAASAEREQLSALSLSVPVSTQPTPGWDDPSLHVSFPFSRTIGAIWQRRKAQAGCTHLRRFDRIFLPKPHCRARGKESCEVGHSADRSGLNSQSSVLNVILSCVDPAPFELVQELASARR